MNVVSFLCSARTRLLKATKVKRKSLRTKMPKRPYHIVIS